MPVNKRLDKFTAVKFVVIVSIVHFEVMKLKLLLRHFGRVNRNSNMLSNVTEHKKKKNSLNLLL